MLPCIHHILSIYFLKAEVLNFFNVKTVRGGGRSFTRTLYSGSFGNGSPQICLISIQALDCKDNTDLASTAVGLCHNGKQRSEFKLH